MRRICTAFAVTLLSLATAGTGSAAVPPSRAATAPGPRHIVVIVFENKEAAAIMSPRSDARYFRSLARSGVTLTRLFAIRHPSLPNYLALTSGGTHGVTSDCTTCLIDDVNLVDQLEDASISWKAYLESMPGSCSRAPVDGRYVMKHNPFMYYTGIRNDPARCADVVPLRQLRSDLAADALPSFAWISPNLCHDMHDCSIATGDRFLRTWVERLTPALGTDGVIITLFDEGYTSAGCCHGRAAGGHIAGIISGPGAGAGVSIRTRVDQYSILRLIEDAWGLDPLGEAARGPLIDGWQALAVDGGAA
jgi:phosphatidylinositol-3-phosphatase